MILCLGMGKFLGKITISLEYCTFSKWTKMALIAILEKYVDLSSPLLTFT